VLQISSPANTSPDAYAGDEICSTCHAPQAEQFAKTVHAKAASGKATYGTGCESCHGPGKAHMEAMAAGNTEAGRKLIFSFKGKPAENADRCLYCHNSSPDQRLFDRSEHKMMGVACNQCHSSHLVIAAKAPPKTEFAQAKFFQVPERQEEARWLRESLLKVKQPDLCFGCHKTIQAQFALPAHHRVPEGQIKCTDCHESHGTMNRPLLKKANFEVCVGCHAEKRGPFLYEHASVKVEGCTACHSPHGTVEPHLLLRREGRFLCLQCHVNPSATNVPHSRLSFQTRGDCVRCHVQIHGSNADQFFLQ
jgi:predicted CXXCH cytochrome family protein